MHTQNTFLERISYSTVANMARLQMCIKLSSCVLTVFFICTILHSFPDSGCLTRITEIKCFNPHITHDSFRLSLTDKTY